MKPKLYNPFKPLYYVKNKDNKLRVYKATPNPDTEDIMLLSILGYPLLSMLFLLFLVSAPSISIKTSLILSVIFLVLLEIIGNINSMFNTPNKIMEVTSCKDDNGTTMDKIVVPMIMNTESDDEGLRWLDRKQSNYVNNIVKASHEKQRQISLRMQQESFLQMEEAKKEQHRNSEKQFDNVIDEYVNNSNIKIR